MYGDVLENLETHGAENSEGEANCWPAGRSHRFLCGYADVFLGGWQRREVDVLNCTITEMGLGLRPLITVFEVRRAPQPTLCAVFVCATVLCALCAARVLCTLAVSAVRACVSVVCVARAVCML